MGKATFFLIGTPGADGMTYFSGPLAVNSYVETLDDLYSDEMAEALKDIGNNYTIIYVEKTFTQSTSSFNGEIRNRGAFFIHVGWQNNKPIFKEILLGSMFDGSPNVDILRAIADMDLGDGVIVIEKDDDGNYIANVKKELTIPDLPEYIKDQTLSFKENQEWENLGKDEWSILDVEIEYLNNPEGRLGSCQKLYEILYSISKDVLIVDKNPNGRLKFDIKPKENNTKQTLYLKDVVINKSKLITSPTNNSFYVINFENVIGEGIIFDPDKDEVLLAINNDFVSPLVFRYNFNKRIGKDVNILTFNILKSFLNNYSGDILFSALILRHGDVNNITSQEIYAELENEDSEINFDNLRYFIYKLYTINRFKYLKPKQYVYLTNDVTGNIVWDNKFIANTRDSAIKKKLNYDDPSIEISNNIAKINLGDFQISSNCNYFVFFNKFYIYDAIVKYENKKLIVYIETDELYWDPSDEEFTISILFHDDAAANFVHDLAKDYLTKRDAVDILSRGTLNLGNFLTKNDLDKISPKNHTHPSYATKWHTHDTRYAVVKHNHLEFNAYNELLLKILDHLNLTEQYTEFVKTKDLFVLPTKKYYNENYELVEDLVEFEPLTLEKVNIPLQQNSDIDNNPTPIPFNDEEYRTICYGDEFRRRVVYPGDYYRYIKTNAPDFSSGNKYYILNNGTFERIYEKIESRDIYVYTEEDIYDVTKVYYEKVVKFDGNGPTLSSYELIQDLINKYFIDLGITTDEYGHLSPFIKSDKVIVENEELKDFVEKDEVFIDDVLKKLKDKYEYTNANKTTLNIDRINNGRSPIKIGGFDIGDEIPRNVQSFIETLMSPKEILYKNTPYKFAIEIYDGNNNKIDSLRHDGIGPYSFDIKIMDILDNEVPVFLSDIIVKLNSVIIHRNNLTDRYDLDVYFGEDYSIPIVVSVMTSDDTRDLIGPDRLVLKSNYPSVLITSSNNTDNIGSLLYNEFYGNKATIDNHSGKYLIIGVSKGFNIKIKDLRYNVDATHALKYLTSMTKHFGDDIEYDFYSLSTLGDIECKDFEVEVVE